MTDGTHLGYYKHDRLPHFDQAGCIQFLTTVLADAAPAKRQPHHKTDVRIGGDRVFLNMDQQLDRGAGSCVLRKLTAAKQFIDVFHELSETHLTPLAWVVMPNHVHMLVRQQEGAVLGEIMRLLKTRSALRINRALGRTGKLWQAGYFDRAMRSIEHIRGTVEYIHENPVRAGLVGRQEDWQFSSIHGFSMEGLLELVDPRRSMKHS